MPNVRLIFYFVVHTFFYKTRYECIVLNEIPVENGREFVPSNGFHSARGSISQIEQKRGISISLILVSSLLIIIVLLVVLLLALVVYAFLTRPDKLTEARYCLKSNCVKASGVMLSKMNRSVDPCDDFYEFACGQWIRDTHIPNKMLQWNEIYRIGIESWMTVKRRIENGDRPKNNDRLNKAQIKAKMLYQSCMNDTMLQSLGTKPLREFVNSLGGWLLTNLDDDRPAEMIEKTLTKLYRNGYYPIVWIGVAVDEMNTSRQIIMVDQPILSLANVQQYSLVTINELLQGNVSESMKLLFNFISYVAKDIFSIENSIQLNHSIGEMVEFEAHLAMIMMSDAQKRGEDVHKSYHLSTLEELHRHVPFINWPKYVADILPEENITENEPIVVKGIDWLENVNVFVREYQSSERGRRIIENYGKWRAIMHQFLFLGHRCSNFPQSIKPFIHNLLMVSDRWIFCLARTMQIITIPLASLFVRQPKGGMVRQQVEQITKTVMDVLREDVIANDWMDKRTKSTAIRKAEKIRPLIAYPDRIFHDSQDMEREYEELDVQADQFFWNMLRGMRFAKKQETRQLRMLPNRTRWTIESSPLQVNAFYNFEKNIIVVPAAILSPPLVTIGTPNAINFASIGSIIGHELIHAFDNTGRHYDENGNIRDWWSDEAKIQYDRKSQCFADQYSNYTVQGHRLNGLRTVSENIADNVGLQLAYKAWRIRDDHDGLLFPGLNMTSEQTFFLSYAQTWCAKVNRQYQLFQVYHHDHSTERLR